MSPATTTKVSEIFYSQQPLSLQQALTIRRGPHESRGGTPLPLGWQDQPAIVEAQRILAREALEQANPYPEGQFQGRGVVIVGGGPYWAAAWVSLRLLRWAGCTLPAELWYFRHSNELTDAQQAMFASQDCVCRDLSHANHLRPYRHQLGGWEAKPLALIESSFEDILYLDADCYVTRDPTDLFEDPGYRDRGAIFFPDGRAERLTPKAWHIFGIPYHDEPAFESGQLLINKRMWWRTLQLVWHLNSHSDFYYRWNGYTDPERVLYGDKDTFHMAAWLSNQPYTLWWQEPLVQDDAYLHRDAQGKIRFIHRCRNKFHLNHLKRDGQGVTFGTTPQPAPRTRVTPQLPREEEAWLAFLEAEALEQERTKNPPSYPVVVCVPTLCRYDLLGKLLYALEKGSLLPDKVVIIDNGGKCPPFTSELFEVEIVQPGRNLGVAASWNWCLQQAKQDGIPAIVIANDDVIPAFRTLESLYQELHQDPRALVVTADDASGLFRWSLFVQRTHSLETVGPYDEEFWPSYYEDNDYQRRLQLTGQDARTATGATFAHLQSATQQRLPPAVLDLHNHFYQHNKERYLTKWGGQPHQEVFQAPFNRITWDYLPGAFDFQDVYLEAIHMAPIGGTLVEVGCYQGRSLLFLATSAWQAAKNLRVYGVEHGLGSPSACPHDRGLIAKYGSLAALLAANIARADMTDKMGLLVMPSTAGAQLFGNLSLDLVYIDAAHDHVNVLADLNAWWPKIKVGGALAGHDYFHPECPDVKTTVDQFFASHHDHHGVHTLGGSFRVFKSAGASVPEAKQPTKHFPLTFLVIRRSPQNWNLETERMLAAYCQRYGHQVVYADPGDQELNAGWGKLLAFRLIHGDHVVICDYDIVTLPWAPDLSLYLDPDRFAAVSDPALASPGSLLPALQSGLRPEQQQYNCGFWACPRSLQPILEEAYHLRHQYNSGWHEQPAINEALIRHQIPVQELDYRWNVLLNWERGQGRSLVDILQTSWFVHLAGDPHRQATLHEILNSLPREAEK